MVWVDRLAELFWMLALVGFGLSVYLFMKGTRSYWVFVSAVSCLLAIILPIYGVYLLPVRLESWLLPVTKQGIVVAFFMSVGPWFYLLPQALPEPKRPRRKRA